MGRGGRRFFDYKNALKKFVERIVIMKASEDRRRDNDNCCLTKTEIRVGGWRGWY